AAERVLWATLSFTLEGLRGGLCGGSGDFPDHYNRGRVAVGQKHFEHVDEFGALDRVPADPDRGGLAETFLSRLENRLIGQRARAGHDADIAGLENVRGHDADLAFA